MTRTSSSFEREKPAKKKIPKILVICEDLKSGKKYIEDAAIYYRVKVAVKVVHVGKTDPTNIIETAIKRLGEYDQVFCAIDRDTHEKWDSALRLVDGNKAVEVITSFPCFEYWLLLHFHSHRKPYAKSGNKSPGDCCVEDLRRCEAMENYNKGKEINLFRMLLDKLATARKHAERTLTDAKKTNEWNPSTKFHEFIAYLEKLEEELNS